MDFDRVFNEDCRACPRLAAYLAQQRTTYPGYHARPVSPFGAVGARLLVVGLAPGMHGANATGRPFTGDYAGILLYETLHRFGFSNVPRSVSADDGLELYDCRITNAVKCLPPQNKPSVEEIDTCNTYLHKEIRQLPSGSVILALGTIAHKAVLKALGLKQAAYRFGHGNLHLPVAHLHLLDSYHCSRYNTQTGRLTPEMFHEVFARARALLEAGLGS